MSEASQRDNLYPLQPGSQEVTFILLSSSQVYYLSSVRSTEKGKIFYFEVEICVGLDLIVNCNLFFFVSTFDIFFLFSQHQNTFKLTREIFVIPTPNKIEQEYI